LLPETRVTSISVFSLFWRIIPTISNSLSKRAVSRIRDLMDYLADVFVEELQKALNNANEYKLTY
jgi:hypothetical protein